MIMNIWAKLKARKNLISAFRAAGIYKTVGPDERKLFPKIHSLQIENGKQFFVFTLLTGMDPKDIKKKHYCFQQVFGENIEVVGDSKKFTLTVYTASMPSELTYNHNEYASDIKCHSLPIIAGKDRNGALITYNMVDNPHLLIAGETGSGKSTQLRSILTTLIKALPADKLKLHLCDLKRSEFHLFRQVEHVQGVYVSAKEMMPVFRYLQGEMKLRGDLLDKHELSHVDDLPEALPYIVVCIDEVALLQNEKRLMGLVEEISAIGRALGIFLILSMQRPDSKVLDGKLKNNLTVRMGFKCADLINSRIIGTPGSEKLKEPGKFLLKLPTYSELKQCYAPYLSLNEAKKLLESHRCQKPKNEYIHRSNASNIELTNIDIFGVLDDEE
jgi:DNA segregation ATPase FtsK/SpoIIIE, S-DNA-T family